MKNDFRLLMLSAMYENGGNTTHRFLDGHPELFVYPFESQIGSKYVLDHFTSLFPVKYRWPVFSLDATPFEDYKAIIDEEGKIRARTSHVSKFRHMPFEFSDDERCRIYENYVKASGRSTAKNVEAFFRATFDAWKDYKRTGREKMYVGYSPIIVVDGQRIIKDMPNAHILHVVRNPWSAYADTKKRAVPLSLHHYMIAWVENQFHALLCKELFPNNVHVLRTEDILANPVKELGALMEKLGLESNPSLGTPTWNGTALEEVYPWGTIRKATPEANLATARELSAEEQSLIRTYAGHYLDVFDHKSFLKS